MKTSKYSNYHPLLITLKKVCQNLDKGHQMYFLKRVKFYQIHAHKLLAIKKYFQDKKLKPMNRVRCLMNFLL